MGDAAPLVDGGYSWRLSFGVPPELRGHVRIPGERCEISGWAGTTEEALETMRRLAARPDPDGVYGRASFALGSNEQVEPRTVNCYSVGTERLEELDDLPRRLAAQIEEHRDGLTGAR